MVSAGLHGIAVLLVAGTTIERPAPSDAPEAIGVTLLADREGAPIDRAAGEAVPPAPAPPRVLPEPAPRARPVARSPAPAPAPGSARAASPPAESLPVAAESGSGATSPGEREDGVFARPAPGSGEGLLYGEHDVDRVAGPVAGIRRPSYPPRERMLGREGRVSLLVHVDPSGAVRDVQVTSSAGEAFDAAARRAVEATPFRPAERGGLAVASTVTVNVSFELD